MESSVFEIAHGKVGQVELCHRPFRRQSFDLLSRHAATKKGELIAELAAVFRGEVSGVVPPFGAESVMRAVIARKLVAIAFRRKPEFLGAIGGTRRANDA